MLDETQEEAPLTHDLEMFGTYVDAEGRTWFESPEIECEIRQAGVGVYWPGLDSLILLGLVLANKPGPTSKEKRSDEARHRAALKLILGRDGRHPITAEDPDIFALRWMAEEQFHEEKAVLEHRRTNQTTPEPARRSEAVLAKQAAERFYSSPSNILQQKYSLSYAGETRWDNPQHKFALAYQALHAKDELTTKQHFLESLKAQLGEFGIRFENPININRITK